MPEHESVAPTEERERTTSSGLSGAAGGWSNSYFWCISAAMWNLIKSSAHMLNSLTLEENR